MVDYEKRGITDRIKKGGGFKFLLQLNKEK